MSSAEYFATRYRDARQRFLAAAEFAGASLQHHQLPVLEGPDGEDLYTDVAILGPTSPRRALVVLSATHGVEGYCGSGCQVGLLEDRFDHWLPQGTALILVHALNPHGFAWKRRVNEDGVDLNRNFVDFDAPLPDSRLYERIHEWLVPSAWEGRARDEADAALRTYVAQHGPRAFQAAVTLGQYTRPAGLCYGGTQPTWSARTIAGILSSTLPEDLEHCVVIDIHTGLGPRGYGELISLGGPEACQRARDVFGTEVRTVDAGESVSAPVVGTLNLGIARALGARPLTYMALEFGTVTFEDVLAALRQDHWTWSHAACDPAAVSRAQAAMFGAFFGQEAAWQAAVYGGAADMTARALRALGRD